MRLTLRTLLAYMDEILEPGDREELAKKVESSDFAHDLIHRTKDTMRRLRLSAPQVVGTGMGLDPNTVAEYLDNVLPPDSVADFERICLESDVHLAEVASAHHVLTMVLGEPAEIDPASRQRMYSIPTEAEERKRLRVEAAHVVPAIEHGLAAAAAAPQADPAASITPAASFRGDSVPDYLRASTWTRHGTLLAACAVVLLCAVSWLVYVSAGSWLGDGKKVAGGATNGSLPIAESPRPAESPAQPPAAYGESVEGESTSAAVEPSTAPAIPSVTESFTVEQPAAVAAGAQPGPATTAPATIAAAPPLPVPALESAAPLTPPQEPAVASAAPPASETGVSPNPTTVEPDNLYAGAAAKSPTAESVVPMPAAADLAKSTPRPPLESDTASVPRPEPEDIVGQPAEPVERAEPVELGTYLDGKNVLLLFDRESGGWYRLTPRATLQPGDRLLALPAFFPKLTFASGLHLKLVGGTLIELGPAAAGANEPAITIDYGQVVIVNTTNDDSRLKLTIAGQTADIRLGRNATLAVDVVPKFEPGLDPRMSPAPVVATLYARDGEVTWGDASGSSAISAPAVWTIIDGASSPVSRNVAFPDWVDHEPVEQKSEQLFGAPAVETALQPGRPVEEQLLELYQSSRRREVKSLVARSSVYAGLFLPFVESLRDSDQKSAWKTHIDTLRTAMSLGPESAEKIYQTLVEQRGKPAAEDLYQLLCGYSPQQIGTAEEFQNRLGVQLVDWMENDSLDYRVLAVQDMGEITGMRLMSNPAGTPTERARGIRLWRQRLKAGEVEPLLPK